MPKEVKAVTDFRILSITLSAIIFFLTGLTGSPGFAGEADTLISNIPVGSKLVFSRNVIFPANTNKAAISGDCFLAKFKPFMWAPSPRNEVIGTGDSLTVIPSDEVPPNPYTRKGRDYVFLSSVKGYMFALGCSHFLRHDRTIGRPAFFTLSMLKKEYSSLFRVEEPPAKDIGDSPVATFTGSINSCGYRLSAPGLPDAQGVSGQATKPQSRIAVDADQTAVPDALVSHGIR